MSSKSNPTAVILAGGYGTRLAPLTESIPKPLLPVLGEAAVRHIISLLCENGIDECILTLGYLPELIRDELGSCCSGVELKYFVEKEPLGTAGGVRGAVGEAVCGDVLVISGDCICDFDLKKAYEFHKAKNAAATILTKRHPNPTCYGVVVGGEDGRIKHFIEKPSRNSVFSDSVNTGVYILSAKAIEQIPKNEKYDFAADLFPKLLGAGEGLYAYECDGDWCDIGTFDDYRRCNTDALRGKYSLPYPPKAPTGCYLTSCGTGVTVGEGSSVVSSVLFDGVKIGNNCKITAAVVGKDTVIGDGAVVHCSAVIGHGCVIEPGAEIDEDCVIGNFERIGGRNGMRLKNGGLFLPDGFSLGSVPSPSPLFCLGRAAARACELIGVCHDGSEAGKAAAKSFSFGVICSGCDVYLFGKTVKSAARAANKFFKLGLTAYFYKSGNEYRVTFYDINGLCPTKDTENEVIKAFNTQKDTFVLPTGKITEITELNRLYRAFVTSEIHPLDGISVEVGEGGELLREISVGAGATVLCGGTPDASVYIGDGGEEIKLRFKSGKVAEKYSLLALLLSLDVPKKLSLPFDTPPLVVSAAEKSGFEVGYYLLTGRGTGENEKNRANFYDCLYTEDMIFACVRVLGLLKKSGGEIDLPSELCYARIKVESYPSDEENLGKIMRGLYEQSDVPNEYADGVRIKSCGCDAGISCRGTGLRAVIQASSDEAASEFSAELKKKIDSFRGGN